MKALTEIEKDFFEFDEEGRKIIELEYEDIYDLLVLHNSCTPRLKDDFISRMKDVLESDLQISKLKIVLRIKNKRDFSKEKIQQVLYKNFLLFHLQAKKSLRKLNLQGIALIVFGGLFLALSYALMGKINAIFNDIINISGTLVIWEAAYLLIFTRGQKGSRSIRFLRLLSHMIIE